MHNLDLIIDDEYLNNMAEYFEKQGKLLQSMIDSYIKTMKRVAGEGIARGETSEALKSYVEYAGKLNHVISSASMEVRDTILNYLEEIDSQDQYLY